MTLSPIPDLRWARLNGLLAAEPRLHYWPDKGGWVRGGLDERHLRAMFALLLGANPPGRGHTLETGAGLSTLMFLAAEPAHHVCVTPHAALVERTVAFAKNAELDVSRLEVVVDRTANALPSLLAQRRSRLDAALIDVAHEHPTPSADFLCIDNSLMVGGLLFLDDTKLPTMQPLLQLLTAPAWQPIETVGELRLLRKRSERNLGTSGLAS